MRYTLLLGLFSPLLCFGQDATATVAGTERSHLARWQELRHEPMELPGTTELLSFEAASYGRDGIRISWSTLGEGQRERYVVERSTDRLHWEPVDVVRGHASGSRPSVFTVNDPTPPQGAVHYRLVLELEGTMLEWSDEFTVDHTEARGLRIHGDPRPGHFLVSAEGTLSEVLVLNNRGAFIPMQVEYGDGMARVNAEVLPTGTYYVQATVDGKPMLRPLIVEGSLIVGG